MNLIGIGDHRLRNRPSLDDFIDDYYDEFDEIDDEVNERPVQKTDICGGLTTWDSPLDLTGDGRPDILLAEDNVFTWNESLGREGYSAAFRAELDAIRTEAATAGSALNRLLVQ